MTKYLLFSFLLPAVLFARSDKAQDLIDRLLTDPQSDTFQLSPDGSHLAANQYENGSRNLVTLDLTTGELAKISVHGGSRIYAWSWMDGDNLIYGVSKWGSYLVGIYAVGEDLKSRKVKIDDKIKDKALAIYNTLPEVEGEAILINYASQPYKELWRYHRKDNSIEAISSSEEEVLFSSFDQQGQYRLHSKQGEAANERAYFYRANEQEDWQRIDIPDSRIIYGFDATGSTLYTAHGTGKQLAIQAYDPATQAYTGPSYTDPDYGLEGLLLWSMLPDKHFIGYGYEADKPQVHFIDPNEAVLYDSIQAQRPNLFLLPLGKDTRGRSILLSYSDRQPAQVQAYDPKTKQLEVLLDAYPKLDPTSLSTTTPFTFKSRDQVSLNAYYTLPPDHQEGDKHPMVVFIHGGPNARDTWGFNNEVQFFAQLGYAVLQVNFRGSKNMYSPHTFSLLDACRLAPDDVADATRWMIDQGLADPDKVVAYGSSFGAYTALESVARNPGLYSCAIGCSGVYDYSKFIKKLSEKQGDLVAWDTEFYGDPDKDLETYAQLAPVNHPESIDIPVFLIHGNNDPVVSPTQSKQMHKALRKQKLKPKLLTPAWLGHTLEEEKTRLRIYKEIVKFLEKELP